MGRRLLRLTVLCLPNSPPNSPDLRADLVQPGFDFFGWQFSRFPHSPSPSPPGRVPAATTFQPPVGSGRMYIDSILANRTPVARQKMGRRKLGWKIGFRKWFSYRQKDRSRPIMGGRRPAVEAGRSTARPLARRMHHRPDRPAQRPRPPGRPRARPSPPARPHVFRPLAPHFRTARAKCPRNTAGTPPQDRLARAGRVVRTRVRAGAVHGIDLVLGRSPIAVPLPALRG